MFLIYIKNILGKEELRENVVSQQRLSSPKRYDHQPDKSLLEK
jgi:hypothetical protein